MAERACHAPLHYAVRLNSGVRPHESIWIHPNIGSGYPALGCVALALTPEAMREFARFVAHAAAEMERLGPSYDHVHFKDFSDAWRENWADIQLTKIYGA